MIGKTIGNAKFLNGGKFLSFIHVNTRMLFKPRQSLLEIKETLTSSK